MALVSLSKSVRVACAVALMSSLVAGPVFAQSASSGTPRGVAVVQLSNGSTFNWLAKKKTRASVTNPVLVSSENAGPKLRTAIFGKGSYVCSPAGFGKKSRCYAR